jgi:hypothetical protein
LLWPAEIDYTLNSFPCRRTIKQHLILRARTLKNKRIKFVTSRVVVILLSLSAAPFIWAQNPPHSVVVSATKHATTPPLRQIAPLATQRTLPSEIGNSYVGDSDPAIEGPNRHPSANGRLSSDAAATLSTNSGIDILGVGNGFPNYTEQADMPKSNGAAGATQFVQFVDESFAVYDKTNGDVLLGPVNGNTLWQSVGAPCSSETNLDEVAQYDKLANVWVMLMPYYGTPGYLCIAVSQTSDATGQWNAYAFPVPVDTANCHCVPMPDYPKLGVWPDAYYISYNQALVVGGNNTYEGPAACAVDRSAMISGSAATMQCFQNNPINDNGWLPSDVDGTSAPSSGTPNYFMAFDSDNQSLDEWQFHVDWNTPANSTFTGPSKIAVAAFLEPCGDAGTVFTPADNCVPQLNTAQMLGAFGDRLMYRLAYRNFGSYEDIVANHTVQLANGNDQTGIRWYELRNTGAGTAFGVYQQGTYAPPDSNYRFMGSIAMDKAGDIALGYNVSGGSLSPSIRYTGRMPSDSLGTMESEIDILSAAGVTTNSQTDGPVWGDFSSMAIDPTDDCTFWYTNGYIPENGDNHWSTQIASFSFPNCSGGFTLSSAASSLTVSSGSQGTTTLTVTPQGGFDFAVSFSCSGLPTGATCSFSPSQITPSGAAATTQLTISVGTSSSASHRPVGAFLPLTAVALGVCLTGFHKRCGAQMMLLTAIIGLGLMMACSGGTASTGGGGGGTSPTTSAVTVTATGNNLQQTTTITLTVN